MNRFGSRTCRSVVHGSVVGLALAAALGCTDRTSVTAPEVNPTLTVAVGGRTATEALARGVAAALANGPARADLRKAMRASRWSEHKLVLQDYVRAPEGARFVSVLSDALHMPKTDLVELVDQLPLLDFYLPFRKNRLAWRGTPDMLVAAVFDKYAPTIQAYDAGGAAHTLSLTDGAPTRALVVMHPAEVKAVIPGSSASSDGGTIQDANEPTMAWHSEPPAPAPFESKSPWYMRGTPPRMNNTWTVEKPSRLEECDPYTDSCDIGGGYTEPPPTPAGVYLVAWDPERDDGWFGDLELQWQSYGFELPPGDREPYYIAPDWFFSGAPCSKGTAYFNGDETHHEIPLLVSPGIRDVTGITCTHFDRVHGYMLQVIEADGTINGPNDDFGRRLMRPGVVRIDNGVVGPLNATSFWPYWQMYISGDGLERRFGGDGLFSIALALQYK